MRKFRILYVAVLGMFVFLSQPSMAYADLTPTTTTVPTTTVPTTTVPTTTVPTTTVPTTTVPTTTVPTTTVGRIPAWICTTATCTTTTTRPVTTALKPPQLSDFYFSPTVIDTTNSNVVITLTIQATDDSGIRWGLGGPSIRSTNGCRPTYRETNWQLTSGDTKNGTWTSTITINQTAFCFGNFKIDSGSWRSMQIWAPVNWGISSDQSFSMINTSALRGIRGDGCGDSCTETGDIRQNDQITTTSSTTVFTTTPSLIFPQTSISTRPITIGTSPALPILRPTTSTSRFQPTTQSASTTTTAPKSTTTTSIPKCSSNPNAIGGQNIACNNGVNYTANQNVFGGQDFYLRGTGKKIATTKPNALGGTDIFSNGQKTTAVPNVFGGNDYYSKGQKILTSKPNAIGGTDVYQGNKKVQTCTTDRKGKQTCK